MATSKRLYLARDDDALFNSIIDERRLARMNIIDGLHPELRQCVHDYGWTTVKAFLDLGVKKPNHIRHLIETVLNEFSPTRGPNSSQGRKPDYAGIKADHPLNRK